MDCSYPTLRESNTVCTPTTPPHSMAHTNKAGMPGMSQMAQMGLMNPAMQAAMQAGGGRPMMGMMPTAQVSNRANCRA